MDSTTMERVTAEPSDATRTANRPGVPLERPVPTGTERVGGTEENHMDHRDQSAQGDQRDQRPEGTRPIAEPDPEATAESGIAEPATEVSYLPVATPRTDHPQPTRPPALRRRRVGSLRAHALDRPAPLRPDLPPLVPGRVGRTGEDPPPRRGPAHRQPRRGHPLRRPGHHARHRGGARSTGLRSGRLLLPHHPGGGHHVVADRRGARPSRQRLPHPPRPAAAGPGVPGGDQGHVQDVHRPVPAAAIRPGRVRRDRHAGRGPGHPHRRGRGRGVHAHPVPGSGGGQDCSGSPTSRSPPTPW